MSAPSEKVLVSVSGGVNQIPDANTAIVGAAIDSVPSSALAIGATNATAINYGNGSVVHTFTGSVSVTGTVGASNLSGTNTGDQTITLTGDVTGSGTGSFATTISAGAVTNSMLAGSIAASKLVGTDIATVGTVTSGTWNATTIAVNKGGTGQTSYTDGQLLIGNSSGNTLSKATLTQGTGISITNAGGSITIAATGGASGANPTAQVGLVAVNGTATTYLRSDGAPALDQSISPTMSGNWTFSNQIVASGGVATGAIDSSAIGALTLTSDGTGIFLGGMGDDVTVNELLNVGFGVVTPSLDSAGTINIGFGNATAISIGRTGVTTTIDGTLALVNPLAIGSGGTNSATALSNNRVMKSVGGAIVEATAITAARALKSDANGIPVASTATAASLDALSGTNTGDQTITLTGNVTGSGTGSFATTIAAGVVTNSMLAGSITASNLVGTDIATVGTVTSGTWNATTIAVVHGGTGQTSYTDGQLLIGNSSGNTLTKSTLTQGSGISITNAGGSITIAATGGAAATDTVDLTGVDTSALSTGLAGYVSANDVLSLTDATAAASTIGFVGVYNGTTNTVDGFGKSPVVQFTTAGGSPAAGGPVYLALATDDTNTGAGKFTATAPDPSIALSVSYQVGICLNNSNYASLKTAKVWLFPGTLIRN